MRKNSAKRGAVKRALDKTDKVTCTARKRNGSRCSNPPVRGSTVCRMHGAGAPQVKAKANQRLIEMVLPAMRELRKIIDSKTATDADKLKAITMVLQRTGFNERHQIDIGLREPTPFDHLTREGFVILRGREHVIDGDDPDALPPGDGGVGDEALTEMLDRRDRDRDREAQGRLNNRDHDVVTGSVLGPDTDLFGVPKSEEERYRDSGSTEFDRDGTRPAERDWAEYERRIEGLD